MPIFVQEGNFFVKFQNNNIFSIMSKLKKLYQTLNSLQELGLKINTNENGAIKLGGQKTSSIDKAIKELKHNVMI